MDRFLATVQIGVTLMGTLAGVLGGYLASRYLEPSSPGRARRLDPPALVATILVGGGIVYVELILGELVPKALALRFTDTSRSWWPGPWTSWPGFSQVVIAFLTASTRAVLFGCSACKDIGAPHVRVRGGDQAPRQGGARAGRPGPDARRS